MFYQLMMFADLGKQNFATQLGAVVDPSEGNLQYRRRTGPDVIP